MQHVSSAAVVGHADDPAFSASRGESASPGRENRLEHNQNAEAEMHVGVCPAHPNTALLAELLELLLSLECVEHVEVLPAVSDAGIGAALKPLDVLVVLIDGASIDPALKTWLVASDRSGKRSVGVFAPGAVAQPASFEEFGNALVPMDVEHLQEAICRRLSIWTTPTGERRPDKETQRKPC